MNKGRLILLMIVVIATILRAWNLGSVPPSASMDEASISYNAYSVWKTGMDEYGELPTLSHRSYDDWRRATYLYLTVPFTAIFNLNVIAVRLPAVILSVLTVLAIYHTMLFLFSKRPEFSLSVALLASFSLAISPWHIYISRLGHETNAYLAFFVFGFLFFLKGEKNKRWDTILLSMIFFTISMISYYAGQVFIPLFAIGLFIIFRKSLLKMISSDKKILTIFLIFIVLLVPVLKEIFSPHALVRFQGTSTFRPEAHQELFDRRVELRNRAVANKDLIGTVLYNRHLFPLQVLIEGYTAHLKPEWLFTNSMAEPHKVPNMGLLYLWQIPFIAIGIIVLFLGRFLDWQGKKLILLWFFLGPLPASIATQAPHAMRAYSFLPVWQILAGFGLAYALYKLQKFRVLVLFSFILLTLFSIQTFYKNYFTVFPKEQSKSFHYALSKTIPFVLSEERKYQKIVFSNEDNLYQSYMLFLYHSRYDPLLYQKMGGTKSGGFEETHAFDKYEFRPIDWETEVKNKEILYVGNSTDFPASITPIKTFYDLDGTEAIKVVGN